jgi:hypothetical protein
MACGTNNNEQKSRFQEHFCKEQERCIEFPSLSSATAAIHSQQKIELNSNSLPHKSISSNHLVAIDTNSSSSSSSNDTPPQEQSPSIVDGCGSKPTICSLKRRNHIRRKKRYPPGGVIRKLSTTSSSSSSKTALLEILQKKQSV